MNDQQLAALLRMAAEADRLAGDDARLPAAVLLPGMGRALATRKLSRARTWGTAGAAAAVIGLAALAVTRNTNPSRSTPTITSSQRSSRGTDVVTSHPGQSRLTTASAPRIDADPTRNMLLAVFSDECGERTCVVTHDRDDLSGRDPTKMSDEELLGLAMGDRCTPAAEHVFVIGLSGPDASLPRTQVEAHVLAACLGSSPGFDHAPSTLLACLPPGVSAVTASLTLGAEAR